MTQLYLQRFEYRAATKSEFDQAWVAALQTFAKTGNWGGSEAGIRHIASYGTVFKLDFSTWATTSDAIAHAGDFAFRDLRRDHPGVERVADAVSASTVPTLR